MIITLSETAFLESLRKLAATAPTVPEIQIVTICAWCPDNKERTAAALALGFCVSHGICSKCEDAL